jgi:hypothetical protein
MTTQPPRIFSLGNLLTILLAVVTATGMFFVMDARSQTNTRYITELKVDFREVEDAVNELEKEQVRTDTRYDTVISLLSKIDTRLERIEASN